MLKNETVQPKPEKNDTPNAEDGANQCEAMRVMGDCSNRPAKRVKLDGLLYLTVPHLSDAVKRDTQCDEKRILVFRGDAGDGHGNASHDKRYGPLAMITQFLGIHRPKLPFAQIKIRLYLEQDGSFSQELVLPRGWVVVN